MNSLYDLILPAPIPGDLIDVLMFSTFFLHLLFVLMMLGTAILGMAATIIIWGVVVVTQPFSRWVGIVWMFVGVVVFLI